MNRKLKRTLFVSSSLNNDVNELVLDILRKTMEEYCSGAK